MQDAILEEKTSQTLLYQIRKLKHQPTTPLNTELRNQYLTEIQRRNQEELQDPITAINEACLLLHPEYDIPEIIQETHQYLYNQIEKYLKTNNLNKSD